MGVITSDPAPYLCTHSELPPWAQDNDAILTGYRRPGGTHAALQERLRHAVTEAFDSEQIHDVDEILIAALSTPGRQTRSRVRAATGGANGSASTTSTPAQSVAARSRSTARRSSVVAEPRLAAAEEEAPFEHDTYAKCWYSVWHYWHNETVNIHTHLWGAVAVVFLAFLHLLHHFNRLPKSFAAIAHSSLFTPPPFAAAASSAVASAAAAEVRAGAGKWGLVPAVLRPAVASASSSLLGATSISPNLARKPASLSHILHFAPGALSRYTTSRAPSWMDVIGFSTFFLGAVACLSFSASFHTFQSHSNRVCRSFNQLDYVGIVVMTCGSFVPALHYAFHCHPYLQMFYTAANLLLGSAAITLVVNHTYATPHYRPIRTGVFLAHGLSALVPVAHVIALYGASNVARMMGLPYLIASGSFYVVGAGLYVARVPERLRPGKFDLIVSLFLAGLEGFVSKGPVLTASEHDASSSSTTNRAHRIRFFTSSSSAPPLRTTSPYGAGTLFGTRSSRFITLPLEQSTLA